LSSRESSLPLDLWEISRQVNEATKLKSVPPSVPVRPAKDALVFKPHWHLNLLGKWNLHGKMRYSELLIGCH
jgi:hypothetical protein